MASRDDDLAAEKTEGYKAGAKLTLDQYENLDKGDESLERYKAQLLGGTGGTSQRLAVDPNDKRNCVITALAMETAGRPDIVIDLSKPNALNELKSTPFVIKEGVTFCMKASFRVQHQLLSGLKYIQVVKRKGIRVSKDQEMIGSYPPNTSDRPIYEKKFAEEEAPSGMLARGTYNAISRFVDDDDQEHLQFEWTFEIKKDWK